MNPTRYLSTMRLLATALALLAGTAQASTGRSRNERLFVVPAPGAVVADGDLADWDRSGGIDVFSAPETRAERSARLYAMYDAEAFYLAGDVTDATPMVNVNSPITAAGRGWNADAFQMRLFLKPTYPGVGGSFAGYHEPDELTYAVAHLTMWYYTTEKQPVLQLAYGMRYALPKAGWKDGVVPADKFQAAYRKRDDGSGYTFEYRIPWSTLGDEHHPKAGDVTAASLQLHWGTEHGDAIRPGGVATDLQARAGFAFQSAACWGKLIFLDRGKLDPALLAEGVEPVPPTPLTFDYKLPRDGKVTIALLDADGRPVRHIVTARQRFAGPVTEAWDGRADNGEFLPPGDYQWKGIVHDGLKTKWKLSVHNSGHDPWKGNQDIMTGGWGADHGEPSAVAPAGEGRMLAGWSGAEGGSGFIGTDFEGRKWFGQKHSIEEPGLIATDERFAYIHGYVSGNRIITRMSLETGLAVGFEGGAGEVALPPSIVTVPQGIAVDDSRLYVAFPGWLSPRWWQQRPEDIPQVDDAARRNRILIANKTTGKVERILELPGAATQGQPQLGQITLHPQTGDIIAVLGDQVVRIHRETGAVAVLLDQQVDTPTALAFDRQGLLYVACRGKQQQVRVFDAAGKLVRAIGRDGGRPPLGKWDGTGMLNPVSIAFDSRGKLWVAEHDHYPKRISVWEPDSGQLHREFFGASHYSTVPTMDPTDPTRIYLHGVQWKVDIDAGTWRPEAVVANSETTSIRLRPFTHANGRQYAQVFRYHVSMRDGDVFRPVASILAVDALKDRPWFESWHKDWKHGNQLFWSDANGDFEIQPEELQKLPFGMMYWGFHLDDELNIHSASEYTTERYYTLPPAKILPNGVPVYDGAAVREFGPGGQSFRHTGHVLGDPRERALYALGTEFNPADRRRIAPGLTKWSFDGQLLWSYWNAEPSMVSALALPIPKPGEIFGAITFLGKGGPFVAIQSYFGTVDIVTEDGLYVDQIFKDQRLGETGPDLIQCEFFGGQFVRTVPDGRYFVLAGDQDGRVTEVLGLESMQRFAGTHTIKAADLERARAALAAFESAQRTVAAPIVHRLDKLPHWELARQATRTVDDQRRFRVALAHDAKHLIVRYDVESPHGLVNSIPEDRLIFRGGNLLDLELQTNPNADPERKTAGEGDVRLLITRRGDQPLAVAYFKKVAGFTGQPERFESPTGVETFDVVRTIPVEMDYAPIPGAGFLVTVRIPLDAIGLKLESGGRLRFDAGYRYGNATGSAVAARAYVFNRGTLANVLFDLPSETRMEPNQWGTATVE